MEQEIRPLENTDSIFTEKDLKPKEYVKHIRFARIILYILAGLQLLGLFLLPDMDEASQMSTIGLGILFCLSFLALAGWSFRDPAKAFLIALILYAGIILLNLFFDPSSLVKGAGIKVIAFLLLFNGYRNARVAIKTNKH